MVLPTTFSHLNLLQTKVLMYKLFIKKNVFSGDCRSLCMSSSKCKIAVAQRLDDMQLTEDWIIDCRLYDQSERISLLEESETSTVFYPIKGK